MNPKAAPINLRVVRRDAIDPAAVASLINDAYTKYPFMREPRTTPGRLLDELGDGELILAEDRGELAGCAIVCPSLDVHSTEGMPGDYRHASTLYLGLAAVSRKAQGRGVGRRLVAEAEKLAAERCYCRVLLGALVEMGNVDYYAKLGYRTLSKDRFEAGHWGLSIEHWRHLMARDIPPHFRLAQPSEAAALAELVNLAYRVEDFFIDGNRTNETEVSRCLAEDAFIVVDGPQGRLAGAVYVSVNGQRGYFGMLSVAPERQRGGLGGQLIGAAEDFCRARGCTVMELTAVNLREELPPFYSRFGYTVSGTAPWAEAGMEKLKMPAHFIVMSKSLAPEPAGRRR